jgi:hypothetical protein
LITGFEVAPAQKNVVETSNGAHLNGTNPPGNACSAIHAFTVCVNKSGKIVTPECSSRASIALTRTHCQQGFWIPAKCTRE